MNKDNNNKKIEEILEAFTGARRAGAPDFFYTRLKAKMERQADTEPRRAWILRPAYSFSVLFLVLAVNAFALLKGNQHTNVTNTETAATDAEVMQSIASEYSINSNITYDLNQ